MQEKKSKYSRRSWPTFHIPLGICEVLAIFKIDAKEVDQVDMKWVSEEEFGTQFKP